MNETRRNGVNRMRVLMMEDVSGQSPIHIPGKRTCSTVGCNSILSGYNPANFCSVCKSRQLSRAYQQAAQEQARRDKTAKIQGNYDSDKQRKIPEGIQFLISIGSVKACACGCGRTFPVKGNVGRDRMYATANCGQNHRNRQAREQ